MMPQLTLRQAHEYAKLRGRSLKVSYLGKIARKDPQRLGAEFITLPTGVGYWVVDEDALAAYLESTKK